MKEIKNKAQLKEVLSIITNKSLSKRKDYPYMTGFEIANAIKTSSATISRYLNNKTNISEEKCQALINHINFVIKKEKEKPTTLNEVKEKPTTLNEVKEKPTTLILIKNRDVKDKIKRKIKVLKILEDICENRTKMGEAYYSMSDRERYLMEDAWEKLLDD